MRWAGPRQRVQRSGLKRRFSLDGQLLIERSLLQEPPRSGRPAAPAPPGGEVLPEHPGGSLKRAVQPGHHPEQACSSPRRWGPSTPGHPGPPPPSQAEPMQRLAGVLRRHETTGPAEPTGEAASAGAPGCCPFAVPARQQPRPHPSGASARPFCPVGGPAGATAGVPAAPLTGLFPCAEAPGHVNEVSPYE